ncbi:hypothetical protein THJ062_04130 [Campylobacter jejuni]|nr:hypothetical protein THJ062_04130 [Campylobacter jejuni]
MMIRLAGKLTFTSLPKTSLIIISFAKISFVKKMLKQIINKNIFLSTISPRK